MLTLGIPPTVTSDTFLFDGKHKHLLIVINTKTEEAFILGYATSKKDVLEIANIQHNNVATNLNTVQDTKQSKTQYCKVYNNFEQLKKEDVEKIVKSGEEYLSKKLSAMAKEALIDHCNILRIKPVYMHDNRSFTKKKDVVDMYNAHVKDILTKKPLLIPDYQKKNMMLNRNKSNRRLISLKNKIKIKKK